MVSGRPVGRGRKIKVEKTARLSSLAGIGPKAGQAVRAAHPEQARRTGAAAVGLAEAVGPLDNTALQAAESDRQVAVGA